MSYQQKTQQRVSLFRDVPQPPPISAQLLRWHQSQIAGDLLAAMEPLHSAGSGTQSAPCISSVHNRDHGGWCELSAKGARCPINYSVSAGMLSGARRISWQGLGSFSLFESGKDLFHYRRDLFGVGFQGSCGDEFFPSLTGLHGTIAEHRDPLPAKTVVECCSLIL